MSTQATIVSLEGQAWAQSSTGERRALKIGDRLTADEVLVTSDDAVIGVDFGHGNQLTFVGAQQMTVADGIELATESAEDSGQLSQPSDLAPLPELEEIAPTNTNETPITRGRVVLKEGHDFVNLVRISEQIEADGFTPVTLVRIQEELRPFGMSLPEWQDDTEHRYEHSGWTEREVGPASRSPVISVTLKGAGADGIYNQDEITDGTVPAYITLDSQVRAGDILVVTDSKGNTLLNRPVTDEEVANGLIVQVPVSPGDKQVTVNATITTPSGSSSTDFDDKPVDNVTPTVEIELQGAGSDGTYNDSEITDGKVPAEVTLDPNTVKVGDTLVVTTPDGEELLNRPVTQDNISKGVTVDVPVTPGQETVTVEATITDPAGNSSDATDEKPVDNVTPQLEIELQGAGPDGTYNESEITDGKVPAEVTLDPNTVKVGDTLVVTTPDGEELLNRPVTQDDISNGVTVDVPVTPGQEKVTVEATITDPAGNSSDAINEKPVDNLAPVLAELPNQEDEDADSIDLDLRQHFTDNKTPASELEITVAGLPEGLEYDPVTGKITGEIDNSASQNGPSNNGKYPIKVTVTDKAGNTSETEFEWAVTNPPPVATDDTQTTNEDTIATGNVLTGEGNDDPNSGQDIDPDGDELKVTEFTVEGDATVYKAGDTATIAGVGELTLNANGDYTFTPEQDWNGTVPDVNYTISDGEGGTSSADLKITVTPDNDAPEAVTPATPLDQTDVDADSASVTLDLDNLFSDVDNTHEELTFTAAGLPPGLTFNPATGEITGTIDRSASQGGPNNDGVYEVTVTATDPDGLSADQNFNWTVTNPAPEAENDAGETLKSARLTKDAANGVLENDSDPDGDPLFVQGVTQGGETVTKNANGELVIKGEYGTLVLQPDGSYEYTPDLSDKDGPVWKLDEGSTLTDTFTYTVSDGEGGTVEADLEITIKGHSDDPPFLIPEDHNNVGGQTIDGHITVHEKGLSEGTKPGQGHTAEGVINVHAMNGLNEVTITDKDNVEHTFSLAELNALSNSSETIAVKGGTITLTGFEPIEAAYPGGSQVIGGEIKYTYELTADQEHSVGDGNSLTLDIQLAVKDDQNKSSNSSLTVNVIDDVPSAEEDVNQITEDAADPAEGNVLGNDTTGADGATVTGVQAGEVIAGSHVADGNLATLITGKYGTLTLNADGTYSYELDNTNLTVQGLGKDEALKDEVFSYTITDKDGDQSTASLTITINGSNDIVIVDVPTDHTVPLGPDGKPTNPADYAKTDDHVVFESGLVGGSNQDADATKVVSNFTLKALDGLDPTNAFSITYKDANGVEQTFTLGKDAIEALGTATQTITTQYGELLLKAYSQDTDGTITIDYEYTLQNAPTVDAEFTTDDFTITATDRQGATAGTKDSDSQELSIKIIDDAPVAVDDKNQVTEGEGVDAESITTGNVIGHVGTTLPPSTGDKVDTTGADGATVSAITSTNTPANTAAPSTEPDAPVGTLVIEGEYGTLTIQPDGSYSYELDNSNLDVQGLIVDEELTETFNYTIKDGDGDEASADLVITINGANDGVTVTVPEPTDPNDPNKPGEDYPVEDPNDPDKPTWGNINDHVVFESGLVGGSQNSSDTDADAELVMVKSSFTLSALDGLHKDEAITFKVDGKVDITLTKDEVEALSSADTKTIITEYGELVLNGYTLNADGTITIDYEYTLTDAPENSDAGNTTDAGVFTDDTIKITVKDRAGIPDPDTATENLVIRIMDDVPSIDVEAGNVGSLEVDETNFDDVNGQVSATDADFVDGVFTTTEGADGATTTYSLEVTDGTASGLIDTATGESIVLYQDGTDVVGRVEGSTGDVAFRIEIDADTGSVILTQSRALQHPDPNDPDDPVSITNDAIKLHATAMDGDGDTVKSAGVEVGGKFTFRDDGPTLEDNQVGTDGFVIGNEVVDEKYLSSGSKYTDGSQLTVTKELPIDFGADGAVNADGDTGLIFANTGALTGLGLKSGTTDLTYAISTDGRTITAKAGSKDIFTIKLKVAADGTPSYEFTLQGPLNHNLVGDTAENIVLPFDITATDGDGDSVDLKFKVEVVDDTPPSDTRELEVNEDDSVSFSNADINQTTTEIKAGEEPQHGTVTIGNDGTITYEPHEDYRGDDSYTYTVTTASGSYKRIVNVTVKPVADKPLFADKSGNDPDDTAIDADGTLNTGTYDYSVITPEDESVSLKLTLPKIKDDAGTGPADHSELLGAIILTPTGDGYVDDAKLQTGTTELKPKDGKITIVITDNTGDDTPSEGYHVKGDTIPDKNEGEGVYYLTEAEYEAITAHPAEDRHENFDVEVSVKSYEVDEHGVALPNDEVGGTNGAESTQTITVDVHAVTDPVVLKVQDDDTQAGVTVVISDADKTADITFDEDTSFNLTHILAPDAFKDLDGSETRSLTVENLPEGTVIHVEGTAYTIDNTGTATLEIAGDVAHDALPQITITPPQDFSGDLTGIKVILDAKDNDDDSKGNEGFEEPALVTDEVTINLHVKPVAGDVVANPAEGDEDTPIHFLTGVKVTDESTGDTDGGKEIITEVSFTIPEGWTGFTFVKPGDNWAVGGDWGNSEPITIKSPDSGEWTVTIVDRKVTIKAFDNVDEIADINDLQEILGQFTITPPEHSSADVTINLDITSQDTNTLHKGTVDEISVTSTVKKENVGLEVTVSPIAEVISKDGGDNWVLDNGPLQMTQGKVYESSGAEDEFFEIGDKDKFKLSEGWSNEDGKWVKTGENWDENTDDGRSEDTFALLTPYTTVDNDARANATVKDMLEGSVFTYSDGTTTFTLPFAGEPVKIPMQYLDTVRFKGPKDWSGVVKTKVQAHTIDYDEDDSNITDEATSGEAWLTNLIIEPRADQVTLKVDATVKTLEDTAVPLNIIPTSSDPNETFDVTISDIPVGTSIEYWSINESGASVNNTFISSTANTTLEITHFDKTKQPELTPPQDSNEPINLTVKAESVDSLTYINKEGEQVTVVHKGNTKTYYDADGNQVGAPVVDASAPDTAHELPIHIEVQGVPDEPTLTINSEMAYWEDGAEPSSEQSGALGLKVNLADLVTELKSGETGVGGVVDDSETVTLRISGLPEGFTLTNAGPQLGGAGESRVWVISEDDLDKVTIAVPNHYSGTVEFTVQPVVTENDNPSDTFFDEENVKFKVKPVAEASLSISSDLVEDEVGKVNLEPVLNGDMDEYISQVRIAVSELPEGVTLYTDAAGNVPATVTNDYYVFDTSGGNKAPDVYVKGPANHSGDIKLNIDYTVTDPVGDSSTDIDAGTKTDTIDHILKFEAVTDKIGAELNTITADNNDFTFEENSSTATINGSGKVTVKVGVSQKGDDNAGGEKDTDGSEKLTHILIEGVPQGVTVEGALNTGTGQWLIETTDSFDSDTLTKAKDVVFSVTGHASNATSNITITSYSKDTGAQTYEKAELEWTLVVSQTGEAEGELPNVTLTDKEAVQTEDKEGGFSLSDQVGTSLTGGDLEEFNITVTLRTSPDDETEYKNADGSLLTRTEVIEDGKAVVLWTKTESVGQGEDAKVKLDALLDSIKVHTPEHANTNNLPDNDNKLPLDVTVSVHANGVSKKGELQPEVELTPVTDETTVTITAEPVEEGEEITINIELENTADGEFSNIEGNKITITLGDTGLKGELLDANGDPLTATPVGSNTYEVTLGTDGKPPQLTFRPDVTNHPHQTGSLGITASVTATEEGASNTVVSTGTGSLVIVESNSGYEAVITAEGSELNEANSDYIELKFAEAGLVDAAGEKIDSAFISGLPDGFTVWTGEPATMANNAGGGTWAIPLDGNNLPANISIKPPKNWAGTLPKWVEGVEGGLKFTVMSGHTSLTPTPSEIGFELVVNPTPDGVDFTPTLSFGDAGDKIALNLNASMKDPSAATGAKDKDGELTDQYTELTELSLTGFPDGQKVQFYIGGSEVPLDETKATFDGDTWTITGLSQEDLQNLKFLHAEGSTDITVKGRTYEVDAEGIPYQEGGDTKYSAWSVGETAEINISPTVPTSDDDHFLWDGSAINGFGGEDTVQLRFGDSLSKDEGDFSKLENIEIIDMSGTASGDNSITGLTVEDVFNMTDGDNILKILVDAEDSEDYIGLTDDWSDGVADGNNTVYTGSHSGQEVKLEVSTIIID